MAQRKALLDVLQRITPERRPLWFMRQAGRYLPEYRAVREEAGSFLGLCYAPDKAAEVTLQPLRRFDLDAAIVFADILVVPHAMGGDLSFAEGEGPRLGTVRDLDDVGALKPLEDAWQVKRIQDTLRAVRGRLPPAVTLIGFCGAPWTVASYLIEGGSSPDRIHARKAAAERPEWFRQLMARLEEASVAYLRAQLDAGAEVLQIFESWGGDVPWPLQEELVMGPIARIVQGLRKSGHMAPVIVFARGLGASHAAVAEKTGAAALSLEPQVDLTWAARAIACPLQGNLDPAVLAGGGRGLDEQVDRIVAAVPRERHIFNLGHGILQETPVAHVEQMIGRVRSGDG